MKKINLKKQKVVLLVASELQNVKGGAEKRSDRLSGGCHYSRKHPEVAPCQSGGQQWVTGCTSS